MFILLLSGRHTPIEHNFSLIYEVGKSNPLLWIQSSKYIPNIKERNQWAIPKFIHTGVLTNFSNTTLWKF